MRDRSGSLLTSLNLSVKVEGSMLGKSLSATGRRSSMNGTMRKTEKGMSRSRSVVVRLSCRETSMLAQSIQSQERKRGDALDGVHDE